MQFQVHTESEAEEAMVGNLKSPILMAQTWKGPENTRETQHWMCGHGANSGGQEGFSDSARMWDTKNRRQHFIFRYQGASPVVEQ